MYRFNAEWLRTEVPASLLFIVFGVLLGLAHSWIIKKRRFLFSFFLSRGDPLPETGGGDPRRRRSRWPRWWIFARRGPLERMMSIGRWVGRSWRPGGRETGHLPAAAPRPPSAAHRRRRRRRRRRRCRVPRVDRCSSCRRRHRLASNVIDWVYFFFRDGDTVWPIRLLVRLALLPSATDLMQLLRIKEKREGGTIVAAKKKFIEGNWTSPWKKMLWFNNRATARSINTLRDRIFCCFQLDFTVFLSSSR